MSVIHSRVHLVSTRPAYELRGSRSVRVRAGDACSAWAVKGIEGHTFRTRKLALKVAKALNPQPATT